MKLEIKKSLIEIALIKAVKLTNKHLTLPVLQCVLLDLKEDNLVIRSTNLDLGLEINIKTKTTEPGIVAVPGNILLNTITSIRSESIILESENGNLKIKSDRNNILIKGMSHEDFPSIPKINKTKTLKMNSNELVSGFKSVCYSASNSNIKPELSSLYIYESEGNLNFVATDSFRLAEKKLNIKNPSDFPATLIPNKNILDIMKILDGYDGEIDLSFDKNQASFETRDMYMVSRLVDGSFPDYKQIIPKNFVSEILVLKSDFANSIKNSTVFVDSLSQVKIKVNAKEKNLEINSKNNDVGEYSEKLKISVLKEGDIELSFNTRYLLDCIQSIVSESIIFEFGGTGKPLILRGNSDISFLYLVMPMNR